MHSRWLGAPAALLILLGFSTSFAETSLKGYSNYFKTITQPDPTTINIYLGNTGKACASPSTTAPCNSCAEINTPISGGTTMGLVCGSNQVHPDLQFSITLSSSVAANYKSCARLVIGTGGSAAGSTLDPFLNTTTVNPNQADQLVTATFKFSQICPFIGSNATCTESVAQKIVTFGFVKDCGSSELAETGIKVQFSLRYVGNSPPQSFGCPTGTGAYESFCDFTVYPGDGKVYLKNLQKGREDFLAGDLKVGTTPATNADPSGMSIAYLRVYYAEGNDFSVLTPASKSKDIEVDGNSVKEGRVTGLTNGTQYVFLTASVDQAGNVEGFSDPAAFPGTMSNAVDPIGETQSAIPEEVYGLLDNKKCFIATAAYGSEQATSVETLRQFRNHYLLTWSGGKAFVNFYYQVSPPIAEFIAEREWLKQIVRNTLTPFVMVAQVLLEWSLAGIIIAFATAAALFFGGLRWLRQGRSS